MKSLVFLFVFLVFSAGIPSLIAPDKYLVTENTAIAQTNYGSGVYTTPDTNGESLYTLGVKKPDGSCYVTQKYAKSVGEAMASVAKDCKNCTVDDITGNSFLPGAPDFRQFCLAPGS